MSDYVISCCSTADLSKEYFETRDISYLCFHSEFDGVEHLDDLGQSISFADFYQKMVDGADTKTSQVNAEEYEAYFDKILSSGKDLVHVTLSSGISGSINSALIAKETMQEKYPERKIYVIDSLCASSGFGLLVDKMADLRDEGKTVDEVANWVDSNKGKLQHWFFSSDLTFFIKGGRVTKTAGFIGGVLNICPLLNVNSEGKLIPRSKIRTKKKAIKEIVDVMEQNIEEGIEYADKVFISNSACEEDALAVAKLVEERFPKMKGKVLVNSIGTTIGSHTGPGTVALFFWGKERTE